MLKNTTGFKGSSKSPGYYDDRKPQMMLSGDNGQFTTPENLDF
jgi:hypothetical protein